MAFSPWQILSPVQWARWTWSAVRGGGAGEDEAGGPEGDPEDEDSQAETKSLSFRQVHALLPRFGRATIHPSIRGSFCVRARVCACVCVCVCVCLWLPPALTVFMAVLPSLPVTRSPLCSRKFRTLCPPAGCFPSLVSV